MSRYITLQPSDRVDYITSDGTELTQRPYPFHVDYDGNVLRQDFWCGHPARVVGFITRLDVYEITAEWRSVWQDPELAVNKYLITADKNGTWSTHTMAIQSVKVNESEDEVPTDG